MQQARRPPQPSADPVPKPTSVRPFRRWSMIALVVTSLMGALVFADWWTAIPDEATASYVGGTSCVVCHQTEAAQWHDSYHDRAMDPANASTVLGDFSGKELTHFGITSRMFQRDGKYLVHTEGPDGAMADFEVKYVFGVAPLQQYLVEFDRPTDSKAHEIARLQVLPICWDTGKKHWFFLQPPDVAERVLPGDDLHWTGIAQRWNNMCGDCHTTNYQKNFDVGSKTYRTSFTDMDVNCESCHGPGSLHVDLASSPSLFWDRKRGYALPNLKSTDPRIEVETCAPCHSMRRIVQPGYAGGQPFHDYYANELLHGHLYHADGQILEEVYEYGSFTQSKMYQKGIRCSDCHDPHSTKVKHEGNKLCTSCHQHPAGKYDSPSHHHHDPGREGALCVSCHMPKKTYMAVDPRLDHSLRVPRPDLSIRVDTPNACSGCHLDRGSLAKDKAESLGEYANWLRAASAGDTEVKDALDRVNKWATDRFEEWYGKKPGIEKHFANTLAAARRGDPKSEEALVRLAKDRGLAGIVRATCLFELGQFPSDAASQTAIQLLSDSEPLVRLSAVANLERLQDEELVRRIVPMLSDPIRAVRAEAGRVSARVDERLLNGPERAARERAIAEYRQGLNANNDRALGHLGLAVLAEQSGKLNEARQSYETAISLEPTAAGPRANLAALLEQLAATSQDTTEAEELRAKVKTLREEELNLLARDAELVPTNPSIHYRYGLSLYLNGRLEEAEKELREAVRLSPNSPDFILALILLYQKQERFDDAIELAKKGLELRPDDVYFNQLLRDLNAARQ